MSDSQEKSRDSTLRFVLLGMVVAVILIAGTTAVVLAIVHSNNPGISSAEAALGTGPVSQRTVDAISITALPPAAGKGGDPGDDYPWKNLPMDSKFDPWGEYVRECTSFVAWALHSRNGFEMPFYGDASTWGPQARARGFAVNTSPAPGSVAWENGGDHVAWVSAVNGSSFTIEEYNEHYNGTYDKRTLTSRGKFEFIHFKDLPTVNAAAPSPAPSSSTHPIAAAPTSPKSPSPSQSNTGSSNNSPGSTQGQASGQGSQNPSPISPAPSGSSPGSSSPSGSSPSSSSGGTPSPSTGSSTSSGSSSPSSSGSSSPQSPTVPTPPPTYSETVGGVSHTWTNYSNAGGNEGPSIASNQTVQIACKVPGFAVADGDTWWYRIAQSPWSNQYYVSADAFYNNGATSGSLHGTPFVDPAVPNC